MKRVNRSDRFMAEARAVIVVAIIVLGVLSSEHRIGLQQFFQQNPGGALEPDRTGGSALVIERLPPGYRDWPLISVAVVGPPLNDIRAKLGNDIAIADFRNGTIPYRDGAIIARLAWHQIHDAQTNNAFELQAQQVGLNEAATAKLLSGSAVAGTATNV